MAVEASRSSNSVDSYVGSLISLISKSEIRYEGILFNINTTEASIGLQNVRSFGTEGRKKDGSQLPPSDKVYEYILFRGSDIKDLQVKSTPPVQTTPPIYNDPAIIQSHYPQEAATSTSFPFADTRSQQDLSSYTSQVGLPKSTPQSSLPLNQTSQSAGSWGSLHPSPVTNGSRLPMPDYSQGFFGASNGLQTQSHSFLQPPPGLLIPPSMQETMHYPAMSASLPIMASNLPASPLLDTPPPLLPSFSTGFQSMHSSLFPAQSLATPSNSSRTSITNKAPTQALPTAAVNTTVQLATPPTMFLDKNSFATADAVQPKTSDMVMPYNSVLEPEHSVAGSSAAVLKNGLTSSLVTPNQFLQPGPSTISSSLLSQSLQKDVEEVQVSSNEKSKQILPEAQTPLLPLPAPLDYKGRRGPSHAHHSNRGRGRARGNWASQSITRFTEEFDFVEMNKKFDKDEVWGHLGKTNKPQEDGYSPEEGNAGPSDHEIKPVYVKDDFFDSLSSNASGGSRNGRTRFSEQIRLDNETFGRFSQHRGGRGGRGFHRGGRGFHRGGHGFDISDRGGYGYDHGGHGYGRAQSRGTLSGRSYGYNERGGWRHHAT